MMVLNRKDLPKFLSQPLREDTALSGECVGETIILVFQDVYTLHLITLVTVWRH